MKRNHEIMPKYAQIPNLNKIWAVEHCTDSSHQTDFPKTSFLDSRTSKEIYIRKNLDIHFLSLSYTT